MATAFIQHLASLIRISESDGAAYGDEWGDPVTAIWLAPDEVKLVGLRSEFNVGKFKAVEKLMSALGVNRVIWERVKPGQAPRLISWKVRHDLYRQKHPDE